MKQAKQRILPFFLSMQGCPSRCVYCDQWVISGQTALPTQTEIAAALEHFAPDATAELAYYGGSFTCLPRSVQEDYLNVAAEAIRSGRIGGIRISTRPDAVDAEVCAFLRKQGVVTVELGVQSFDDTVLAACGRGYTAKQALAACAVVRQAGLRLGVQLMTGLPQDNDEQARRSMQQALAAGAELLRIYPTLVLRHTPLAQLYQQGLYRPQTLDEAVFLAADLLQQCCAAGAVMLRMGLHPSAQVEQALLAGPYHPAFGALVREELRFRVLESLMEDYPVHLPAQLQCCAEEVALLYGQKRQRYQQLIQRWPLLRIEAVQDLSRGEMQLLYQEKCKKITETQYCKSLGSEDRI